MNTPTIKVAVDQSFLNGERGIVEGYLVHIRAIPSRPLLFSVHLASGALYSGLPIHALYSPESSRALPKSLEEAQPWSCLEVAKLEVIDYFKDYNVRLLSTGQIGRYLFSVDYVGEGLAQDPEQYKMHHIIALEDSCLVAMPNNYIVFEDKHFTETQVIKLNRSKTYWRTN
jgi:hypothetical protein